MIMWQLFRTTELKYYRKNTIASKSLLVHYREYIVGHMLQRMEWVAGTARNPLWCADRNQRGTFTRNVCQTLNEMYPPSRISQHL